MNSFKLLILLLQALLPALADGFSDHRPGTPLSDAEYDRFFQILKPSWKSGIICLIRKNKGCHDLKIILLDEFENHGLIPEGPICTEFQQAPRFETFCQFAQYRCANHLYYIKRVECPPSVTMEAEPSLLIGGQASDIIDGLVSVMLATDGPVVGTASRGVRAVLEPLGRSAPLGLWAAQGHTPGQRSILEARARRQILQPHGAAETRIAMQPPGARGPLDIQVEHRILEHIIPEIQIEHRVLEPDIKHIIPEPHTEHRDLELDIKHVISEPHTEHQVLELDVKHGIPEPHTKHQVLEPEVKHVIPEPHTEHRVLGPDVKHIVPKPDTKHRVREPDVKHDIPEPHVEHRVLEPEVKHDIPEPHVEHRVLELDGKHIVPKPHIKHWVLEPNVTHVIPKPHIEHQVLGPDIKNIVPEPHIEHRVLQPNVMHVIPEPHVKHHVLEPNITHIVPKLHVEHRILEPNIKHVVHEPHTEHRVLEPDVKHIVPEPHTKHQVLEPDVKHVIPEPHTEHWVLGPDVKHVVPKPDTKHRVREPDVKHVIPKHHTEHRVLEPEVKHIVPKPHTNHRVLEPDVKHDIPEPHVEHRVLEPEVKHDIPEPHVEHRVLELDGKHIVPKLHIEHWVLEPNVTHVIPEPHIEHQVLGPDIKNIVPEPHIEHRVLQPNVTHVIPEPHVKHHVLEPNITHIVPKLHIEHRILEPNITHVVPEPHVEHSVLEPNIVHVVPVPHVDHHVLKPNFQHAVPEIQIEHHVLEPNVTHIVPEIQIEHHVLEPSITHVVPEIQIMHRVLEPDIQQVIPEPHIKHDIPEIQFQNWVLKSKGEEMVFAEQARGGRIVNGKDRGSDTPKLPELRSPLPSSKRLVHLVPKSQRPPDLGRLSSRTPEGSARPSIVDANVKSLIDYTLDMDNEVDRKGLSPPQAVTPRGGGKDWWARMLAAEELVPGRGEIRTLLSSNPWTLPIEAFKGILCKEATSRNCISSQIMHSWMEMENSLLNLGTEVCDNLRRTHWPLCHLCAFCSLKIEQCLADRTLRRAPCPPSGAEATPYLHPRVAEALARAMIPTRRAVGGATTRSPPLPFVCLRLARFGCEEPDVDQWLRVEDISFQHGPEICDDLGRRHPDFCSYKSLQCLNHWLQLGEITRVPCRDTHINQILSDSEAERNILLWMQTGVEGHGGPAPSGTGRTRPHS